MIAKTVPSLVLYTVASERKRRRGIATLWVILSLPVLLVLLGVAVDVGNLWLQRAELESTLEATALAAIKQFAQDGADANAIASAKNAGRAFAAANTVYGKPVIMPDNLDHFDFGEVEVGAAPMGGNAFYTNSFKTPNRVPAVHVKAQYKIPSLWGVLPDFTISARTSAVFTTKPILVRVETFNGSPIPPAFPAPLTPN